jgi:exodeoxyribonuclease-1
LPIKPIPTPTPPVVIGNLKTLSPAMAERWGVDMPLALQHAQTCAERGVSMAGIWPDVFSRPGGERVIDVDENLYGGFVGPQDRTRLDRLLRLDPTDPAWPHASFDDPRLGELVFRYRARNFPSSLTPEEQQRWSDWCAARLHDGAGSGMAIADYLERLDVLAEHADDAGQALLSALVDYAETIAPPLD